MICNHAPHILFIDDEEVMATLTSEGLQKHGLAVTTFCDPVDALQYIETGEQAVDLILTDKNMPRLGGVELAKKIRERGQRFPIILLTGFLENGEEEDILSNGVNSILLKPVSLKEIVNQIHFLIGSEV